MASIPGDTFFSDIDTLVRTAIIAGLAYPAMLLMVRISGHRTLAQLNAFDLIVTIALGSTLASVITAENVALAQGLLAFTLLIVMQFVVAWLASRSPTIERLVNGEPVMLVYRGEFLSQAMQRCRITVDEIRSICRSEGLAGLGDVEVVILETNGQLSVVPRQQDSPPSALVGIPEYPTSDSGAA